MAGDIYFLCRLSYAVDLAYCNRVLDYKVRFSVLEILWSEVWYIPIQ